MRLIASCECDAEDSLRDGVWREDFYCFLTPLRIALPPLRRRPQDVPALAQWFLETHNRGAERQLSGFDDDVLGQFQRYNWPGNVEELQAVVAEACQACEGTSIVEENLPFRFRTGRDAQAERPHTTTDLIPLPEYLERIEKEHIKLALQQTRFNKKKAADVLGITRPRLYRRMEQLGIDDAE